tara:strand:- start:815 stop:964 length:150 start_codon:yes stop_codon:yes gene_type:complete
LLFEILEELAFSVSSEFLLISDGFEEKTNLSAMIPKPKDIIAMIIKLVL